MRGIAVLAVIAIHVTAYFVNITIANSLKITMGTIGIFSHFAVPLFIFLSGFVLYLSYKKTNSPIIFYKKRLGRIFSPYILFSTLYIVYASFSPQDLSFKAISINTYLFKLLTGSSFSHMWFMVLIFQVYLVAPFVLNICNKIRKNKIILILFFSFILQIIWTIGSQEFLAIMKDNDAVYSIIQPIFKIIFLSYFGYFVFGIFISKYLSYFLKFLKKVSFSFCLIVLFLLLSFFSYRHFSHAFIYKNETQVYLLYRVLNLSIQIFYNVFMIMFLYKICWQYITKGRFLKLLSKYSFGIYLVHFGFIYTAGYLLINFTPIHENTWLFYLTLFPFSIFSSLLTTYIISLLPKHKYIIG